MIEESYGEFTIKYNENADKWFGSQGNHEICSSEKLSELKKKLDRQHDKENKFERINILAFDNWDKAKIKKGVITSVVGEEYGSLYVWVTWEDKSRGKVKAKDLKLDNEANQKKAMEITELQTQIKKITDNKFAIIETMEGVKINTDEAI
jgi:hypothetical protein